MDYPDVAEIVAKELASVAFDRGILICGTGIGMQICANKVDGVYARSATIFIPPNARF
jgi:ribose 5-phosphate isomerase B